eukprot:10910614-Alexandrium_andersonii.AAC.1
MVEADLGCGELPELLARGGAAAWPGAPGVALPWSAGPSPAWWLGSCGASPAAARPAAGALEGMLPPGSGA